MQLNNLSRTIKRKKSAQVGRGGRRGKTSGRGTKGQNARAGRKKRPELREIIMKLPKRRGFAFKSIRQKPLCVNLSSLNVFEKGSKVTPQSLIERGIISKKFGGPAIKILANGSLLHPLHISGLLVSEGAFERIIKVGGTVEDKIGLTHLDAVRLARRSLGVGGGASEAGDQAVFIIQRGSKRAKQRRNAPNARVL